MVGEIGPDLQLAVVRDTAPALRRGMQRLLGVFESAIIEVLKVYNHLTDRRAQRNELAALEGRLHPALLRYRELDTMIADERVMSNAFVKGDDCRMIAEHDQLKSSIATLRVQVRALRFKMRPMVIVPELGVAELDSMATHSHDRAVLEVAAAPGYVTRLAMLNERSLNRLASFRRNSGWSARLEFVEGAYLPRSSVTTLLLAGDDELRQAWGDRLLHATGIFDEMLVCRPKEPPSLQVVPADPTESWEDLVTLLFSRRLDLAARMFTFDDDARQKFLQVREVLLHRCDAGDGHVARIWRESGPALVAKLALCVSLFREGEGVSIGVDDILVAARVAESLLVTTTALWTDTRVQAAKQKLTPAPSQPPAPRHPSYQEQEDPVAKMVRKLRAYGPCTVRKLFRGYAYQNYPLLNQILDRAIELGLVERDGKLLVAAGTHVEAASVTATSERQCPA